MSMKRFIAPDMRSALDLVRQEMGPDAIILSSQRTKDGVEIITSLDKDYCAPGAKEKKAFSQQFDDDVDRPFVSDQAWQAQQGVESAAQKYARAELREQKPGSNPLKEQLEKEIEAAKQRMIAAREGRPSKMSRERPSATQEFTRPSAPSQIEGARISETIKHKLDPEESSVQSNVDRQMAGLQEQIEKMAQEHKRKEDEEEKMQTLREEIADMRMLLQQQMWRMQTENTDNIAVSSPIMTSLKDHLSALGLPPELVKKLALAVKPGQRLNSAWRSALAQLTSNVQVDESDPVSGGGIFAFVGPTGVGKTTTIAKLAARYVLQHGLGKVALITTDTYRVGAHDQLKSLGRILNVPVRVVDQERSLASVVTSLKDYPLILVDTAGFRQGDPLLNEQDALLATCPRLKRIMVLASNSQRQTLKASAHAFQRNKLLGCILTKLDETGSLGELLGVVVQQKIPVLYSADGQSIPNDISVASSAAIVAKAVALMKQQRELNANLAAGQ